MIFLTILDFISFEVTISLPPHDYVIFLEHALYSVFSSDLMANNTENDIKLKNYIE